MQGPQWKEGIIIILWVLMVVEVLISLDFFSSIYSLYVQFMRLFLGNPLLRCTFDLIGLAFEIVTLSNFLKIVDLMSLLIVYSFNITHSNGTLTWSMN